MMYNKRKRDLISSLMFLVAVSCYWVKGQEITSTGQHAEANFTWAVMIDNLSFNFSKAIDTTILGNNVYDWTHVLENGQNLVSFRTEALAGGGSSFTADCYYGVDFNNPQSVSVSGVDYKIECSVTGLRLDSQFTIMSALNASFDQSSVRVATGITQLKIETINLNECPEQLGAVHNRTGTSPSYCDGNYNYYDCSSLFACDNRFTGSSATAVCQFDATWSDTAECTEITTTPISTAAESTAVPRTASLTSTDSDSEFTTMTSNASIVRSTSTISVDNGTMENSSDLDTDTDSPCRSGSGLCFSCAAYALGAICFLELLVLIILAWKSVWAKTIWMAVVDVFAFCFAVAGIGMCAASTECDGSYYGVGTAGIVLGTCGVFGLLVGTIGRLQKQDPSCSCCPEQCTQKIGGTAEKRSDILSTSSDHGETEFDAHGDANTIPLIVRRSDILSTPTSSILPPFPVGASPTISTIAKANIQPKDVKISLGGKLFKTIRVSSSSPTKYYRGLPEYDSRVTVRADGENTDVKVNVTITSIQKADHGLEIKFEADGDAKTFSLTVGSQNYHKPKVKPEDIEVELPERRTKSLPARFARRTNGLPARFDSVIEPTTPRRTKSLPVRFDSVIQPTRPRRTKSLPARFDSVIEPTTPRRTKSLPARLEDYEMYPAPQSNTTEDSPNETHGLLPERAMANAASNPTS